MTDRIEDIARRLAFGTSEEGRTVADWADRGEWGDVPNLRPKKLAGYTAAAEYVDELVKGLQEDLRRVVMTWDLPGPVSIVKAMDHAIGIARSGTVHRRSPSDAHPATAGAVCPQPNSPAHQSANCS